MYDVNIRTQREGIQRMVCLSDRQLSKQGFSRLKKEQTPNGFFHTIQRETSQLMEPVRQVCEMRGKRKASAKTNI